MPKRPPGQKASRGKAIRMRSRTPSEQRWLRRQQSDPFVVVAAREGYRSRSAYMLIAIDDRRGLLKAGMRVVERVGSGRMVALHLKAAEPVAGAAFVEGNALAEGTEGWRVTGLVESPVRSAKGNVEFLVSADLPGGVGG